MFGITEDNETTPGSGREIQVCIEETSYTINKKFMNASGDNNLDVVETTTVTGDMDVYKEINKEKIDAEEEKKNDSNFFGPKTRSLKDDLDELDSKSVRSFIDKITEKDRNEDTYGQSGIDLVQFEKQIRNLPRKSVQDLIKTLVIDLDLTESQGLYSVDGEPYIIDNVGSRDVQLDINNIYEYALEFYEKHAFYKLFEEYQLRLFMRDKQQQNDIHTRLKHRFGRRINTRNTRYGTFKPKHYLNLDDLLNITYSFLIPRFVIERDTYEHLHASKLHDVTDARDIDGVDSRSLTKVGVRRSLRNIIHLASEGVDIKLRYKNQLMPLIADLEYSLGITNNIVVISDNEEYNLAVDFYDNITAIYADNLNEYNTLSDKQYKRLKEPPKPRNKNFGSTYEEEEDNNDFPHEGEAIVYNIDNIAKMVRQQ